MDLYTKQKIFVCNDLVHVCMGTSGLVVKKRVWLLQLLKNKHIYNKSKVQVGRQNSTSTEEVAWISKQFTQLNDTE